MRPPALLPRRRDARLPPGPGIELLWRAPAARRDMLGYMVECSERFGDVFTVHLPPPMGSFVVATGPVQIQEILTGAERFAGGRISRMLEPYTGRHTVILAGGPAHLRQRRLLLPPFHGELVSRWRSRIRTLAQEELAALPEGRIMAIRPVLRRITLRIICEVVFGIVDPRRSEVFCTLVGQWLSTPGSFIGFLPWLERNDSPVNPARAFLRRRALVHELILDEIGRRRSEAAGRDDVLSLLLGATDDDGRALSDDELRDELLGLLVSGHVTTATALAWAFELLARHPAARERLVAELDDDGQPYLKAVLNETLRLRPPVIGSLRRTTTATTLGGHELPQGMVVSAMFGVTHRRPDVWDRPLDFVPERFLDGRPAGYAFTPFGGGLRRCIGVALANLELELVLDAALRRFGIAPASSRAEPGRVVGVALVPVHDGRIVLRRRHRETRTASG